MPHKWTSEAQRRAMYAAAEGKSKLGIPKSVGKEMTEGDSRIDAYLDAVRRGDAEGMKNALKDKK